MNPVNVFTEWAPLKEVIIGNSINFKIASFDQTFQLVYRDFIKEAKTQGRYDNFKLSQDYAIERQEDLDNFASLLEDRGIKVRRPLVLDEVHVIKTPFFKSISNPVDSPRDMFLCIGNEIIETSPVTRQRYFEGLFLHDIFKEYFRKGARWTLAPRSSLLMNCFDDSHWKDVKKLNTIDEIEEKYDIAFDAANCIKFGKDILMNVGNKNQELGAFWLQRHVGSEFRVHKVRISDCHIDGNLIPLNENTLLLNSNMKKRINLLPKPLHKCKKIFGITERTRRFQYPKNHIQIASYEGMRINVLSIDEKTVCVRKEDEIIQKKLRSFGFDIIPVQLRHCELFGGGLHCVTLDVRRDEKLIDYWS